MLFTHFGVSGPIILMLSTAAAHKKSAAFPLELRIDLKPALSKEKLDARLRRDFEKYIRKEAVNGLKDLLPQRLIPVLLDQPESPKTARSIRFPANSASVWSKLLRPCPLR